MKSPLWPCSTIHLNSNLQLYACIYSSLALLCIGEFLFWVCLLYIRINFVDNIRIKQFLLFESFAFALFVLIFKLLMSIFAFLLSNTFSINVIKLYSTNGLLTYEASIMFDAFACAYAWMAVEAEILVGTDGQTKISLLIRSLRNWTRRFKLVA